MFARMIKLLSNNPSSIKQAHYALAESMEDSRNPVVRDVFQKCAALVMESSMSDWIRVKKSILDSGMYAPAGFKAHLAGEQIIIGHHDAEYYDGVQVRPPVPFICAGSMRFCDSTTSRLVHKFTKRVEAHRKVCEAKLSHLLEHLHELDFKSRTYLSILESGKAQNGDTQRLYVEFGDVGLILERSVLSRAFNTSQVKLTVSAEFDDGLVKITQHKEDCVFKSSFTSDLPLKISDSSISIGLIRTRDTSRGAHEAELEIGNSRIVVSGRSNSYYDSRNEMRLHLPALDRHIVIQEESLLRGCIIVRQTGVYGVYRSSDTVKFTERLRRQTKEEEQALLEKAAGLYYEEK